MKHITSPKGEKKTKKRIHVFFKENIDILNFFDHVQDIKTHCEANLNI